MPLTKRDMARAERLFRKLDSRRGLIGKIAHMDNARSSSQVREDPSAVLDMFAADLKTGIASPEALISVVR